MEYPELVKSIYEKLQDEGLLKMDLPFAALSTAELRPFEEIDDLIYEEIANRAAFDGVGT